MTRYRKSSSLIIAIVLGFAHLGLAQFLPAQSVQLSQATIDSFNDYVTQAEEGMQSDIRAGRLFSIDYLSASERKQTFDRLLTGEIIIERARLDLPGKNHISGGLIHHWKGLAFFPGASLAATLQLLQSYARYREIYAPTVSASKLKQRNGNTCDVFLRLRQKKILTVIFNTDYTVEYTALGAKAEFIRSRSTRI